MTPESHTISTHHRDSEITVVTERRPDDTWTAVSTVTQDTGRAVLVRRVPLVEGPAAEFRTEAEARDYALRAAMQWIDDNAPATEP